MLPLSKRNTQTASSFNKSLIEETYSPSYPKFADSGLPSFLQTPGTNLYCYKDSQMHPQKSNIETKIYHQKSAVDFSLKNLVSHMPHCAYIKNLSGNILFVNESLQSFLGLIDSDPPWENHQVSILTDNIIITNAEKELVTTGNAQTNIQLVMPSQTHVSHIMLFECIPWQNQAGDLLGSIGILRDVTDSHMQKQSLAESTRILQLVMEHLPVRIFWKDRNLVYLGCNTIFANDMGFEQPDQLIGHDDFYTDMTSEEAVICRTEDFHVLQTSQGRFGSEELIEMNGEKTWIRVSKMPMHNDMGDLVGVLGMYEDINQTKSAQIELENALRQEKELNELKTSFISTVSHEFRNPLAIIQTAVEALSLMGDRLDQTMRQKRFDIILGEIKRMTLLMEDVLFIGQEELQRTSRAFEAINVSDLCQSIVAKFKSEHGTANRIIIHQSGTYCPIIGEPLHLTQIFQNLITNALKYSD